MNIAVTIDDHYFYPLYIMLHTLYEAHPGVRIRVYLIHSRVSAEHKRRLRDVCGKYGGELVEIQVPEKLFVDAPICRHFTREIYYRILAARLIPETEDRVLYLDPDMVVLDSLESVYGIPMNRYLFAGCQDRYINIHHREHLKELHMGAESCYFNSGFLLCNLEKLRREQSVEKVYEMLEAYGEKLEFPDQDLINALYKGKIRRLEDRYNLNPNILYGYEYLLYNFVPFLCKKGPAIIHYMGASKPWNPEYSGGLYQYYWKKEMKYTYRDRKKIRKRLWRNSFYIIKEGCRFAGGLRRKIWNKGGHR